MKKMIYLLYLNGQKCGRWGLILRSTTYYLSRQRNKSSPVYYFGTDFLSTVSSHTYLGITVSSDLKWHEHISNICLKATRTLNFVNCCSQEAKNLAYLSLVRPHLEYATAAWDPYMAKDIQQLVTCSTSCCPFCQKRLSLYNFCHWSAWWTWLVVLVRTS